MGRGRREKGREPENFTDIKYELAEKKTNLI